jgi:chemotaxis protein CheD
MNAWLGAANGAGGIRLKIREGHFHVMAGEIYITQGPLRLDTTLGSCVAVTAWHPQFKVGAMTHYLLPEPGRAEKRKPDGYYGCYALSQVVLELSRQAPLRNFQFGIFGGGSLIGRDMWDSSIAHRNIDFARQWAARHRIHFHQESVGNTDCRRVSFDLSSGLIDIKVYHMERSTK